jgi:hypothetical protein
MGTNEEMGRAGGSGNEPTAEDILATRPSNRELDSALAKPPRRRGKLSSTMLLIVGVLVAAGFSGGLLLGRSTATESGAAPNLPGNFPGGGNPPSGSNVPDGGGFTVGTIERIDGDTVYVQTLEGETVEVRTSGDTDIQVTTEGTADDLAEGETVIVQGDSTDDGSLDATSIVEGGAGFGGFGGAPNGNG